MEFQPAELDRVKEQIRTLGRRDWLWWSVGLLSLLLVAGGALAVFSLAPAVGAGSVSVPQAIFLAFLYLAAVAVVSFNIYALTRGKEAERLKPNLPLETLEN